MLPVYKTLSMMTYDLSISRSDKNTKAPYTLSQLSHSISGLYLLSVEFLPHNFLPRNLCNSRTPAIRVNLVWSNETCYNFKSGFDVFIYYQVDHNPRNVEFDCNIKIYSVNTGKINVISYLMEVFIVCLFSLRKWNYFQNCNLDYTILNIHMNIYEYI